MSRFTLFAILAMATVASTAHAQSSVLAEFYGRGVHAYYGNDVTTAYDYLSKAIDGGINDPRAYYFRGLAAVASGREYEAEADYRAGAELEAKGTFGPAIGQSLSRIQGSHRIAIENMRQQARLDHQLMASKRSKARYQGIEAAEAEVLRESPVPKAPAAAAQPAPPAVPPAAENPFADGPAGAPQIESKDALEGTMTDPFADESVAPAAGDAPAEADPFGGAAPAADDPFGAAAPAAEAAAPPAEDPFGAASDPFAN